METQLGISLGAVALIIGFPTVLMGVVWLLGALEAWTLQRDERAAVIQQLLEQADGADEVEEAATELMAQVADRPGRIARADGGLRAHRGRGTGAPQPERAAS